MAKTTKTMKTATGVRLFVAEPETDRTWKIALEQDSEGVTVKAVSSGDNWYLLKLKNDGTLYRHTYIDKESGFNLDSQGRITESEEEY
jgi:hypothetical protein